MCKRVAAVALVAALILSVAVPVTADHTAEHEMEEACGNIPFVEQLCEVSGVIWQGLDYVTDALAPGGDDFVDQGSSYYVALGLNESIPNEIRNINNSYEATRTMAYRIAEAEFARAMANGTTKSQAQYQADKAVTEYLGKVIQNRFVLRNNRWVSTLSALDNTTGVTVEVHANTLKDNSRFYNTDVEIFSESPASRTFQVTALNAAASTTNYLFVAESVVTDGQSIQQGTVDFSSSDYDSVPLDTVANRFNPSWDMQSEYSKYKSIRTEVIGEISSFSSSVDSDEYDNISAGDVLSPLTLATEFGTSYQDTGSTGYASALAASLGYAVNETGTVYKVELLESRENVTGALYGDYSDFNGQINTSQIYDGANLTVFLATSDGVEGINEDFEVHSIELVNGNTTENASLTNYSIRSLDPTDPLLSNQQLENVSGSAGAGAGGGFGGSSALALALVGVVVGGGAVIYFKQKNGRSRGRSRRGRR